MAWLNTAGAEGNDSASKIITDGNDNIYVLGMFENTVDFDPGPGEFNLTSTAFRDIYLQKLDSDGNFKWAVSFGSAEYESAVDLVVDNTNDKVYILGNHIDTIDLDPGVGEMIVTTQGGSDFYIIVLNSDGSFNDAKVWGSPENDVAYGISLLGNGNLGITGAFETMLDLDPGPNTAIVTNNDQNFDGFVVTLDPNVSYLQSFTLSGDNSIVGYDIDIDTNENIIVSGTFYDTIDFDPSATIFELNTNGDKHIFVAKYTSTNDFIWAKSFGNSGIRLRLGGLSLDNNDDVLITGSYEGSIDLDPGTGVSEISSNGGDDIFISKLDENGDFVWGNGIGGTSFLPDEGFSITSNNNNDVIVSGKFAETVDFNTGAEMHELTSNGEKDIFLLQLNSDGAFMEAYRMGGPNRDVGVAVSVDSSNAVILGGTFRETSDLHPGSGVFNVTSNGGSDAFVMKLNNLVLGTEDITTQNSKIMAYPNPTSGDFSIVLQETLDTVDVAITNMLGQVVVASKFHHQKTIQLLLPVAAGVYFCTVTSSGASNTIKLIKK